MFENTDGNNVYFPPRDDGCLRPSRIMAGGQVFEFGGMCRELMDRSAFVLSAQQMQSTGDRQIPLNMLHFSYLRVTSLSFVVHWHLLCARKGDSFIVSLWMQRVYVQRSDSSLSAGLRSECGLRSV